MSQIGFDPTLDPAAIRSTPSRFQEMTSEDFIRIIFTELSNQDPFEPNDSAALLDQLNSIRSIESDLQLTDRLNNLITQNQLAGAGALLGSFATGLSDDFGRVDGFVIGVSRAGDKVHLELDNGFRISMDQLESVIDPAIILAQQQAEQQRAGLLSQQPVPQQEV
ncbi:MAG: flagellar hook capping FlgD N-terminal domain-containing protein [Phycisphaerales bacterium]